MLKKTMKLGAILSVLLMSIGAIIFSIIISIMLKNYSVKTIKINSQKHVLWIGLDGLSGKALDKMQDPNFKMLEKHSTYNVHGQRSHWSYTAPNYLSIALGQDIPNILYDDFNSTIIPSSIFGTLERSHYKTAMITSVYQTIQKEMGNSGFFKNYTAPNILDQEYKDADTNATKKGIDYFMHEKPSFELLYLTSIDHMGHQYGGWSPEYFEAIKQNGLEIKYILDELQKDPVLAANTLVFITPDHGFSKGTKHHYHVNDEYTKIVPIYYWNINYSSKQANAYQSKTYNARWEWEKWLKL